MAIELQEKNRRSKSEASAVGQTLLNLRWVLVALAIAAVADLLIWRTFSRIGVFIPKEKASVMQTVYDISLQLGNIVLNFSVILAIGALGLALWRFRLGGEFNLRQQTGLSSIWQRRNRRLTVGLIAALVVLFASVALLALVQNLLINTTIRVALLVAFTALAADMWLREQKWLNRLFVALLLAGYWLQLVAKLLHDLVIPTFGLDGLEGIYLPMLMIGELAVVLNGIVLFPAFTGKTALNGGPLRDMLRHPKSLIGAVALVGIFIGLTFLTIAESSIVPILGLYALGYQMLWPLPLYVIALFFLVYTVFYCLGEWKRGPEYRARAIGLVLLFAGGYSFAISDEYLFALVGVLLLARPELLDNPDNFGGQD